MGRQYGIMMEVLAKSGVGAEEIAAIGITNQRETAIVWEKATGKPVYNAIVWQCRRTAERIEEIVKSGRGRNDTEKDGADPRRVFFGFESGMDSGQGGPEARAREAGENCYSARWTAIWYGS